MKNLIVLILTAALGVSIAAKIRGGLEIGRPVNPIHTEEKGDFTATPTPEIIPTFPPMPLTTPDCQMFTDKQCFQDMRPTTQ